MTDQTNNEPPVGIETKNLPHGYAPAPVPFDDTTTIEREAAERDQEVGSKQGAATTGSTETGGDKAASTRGKSGGSTAKS